MLDYISILKYSQINIFESPYLIKETFSVHRSYSKVRIICDACCRVPSHRQDIPQHKVRGRAACGYVMLNDQEQIINQRAKYLGEYTIDQAEYQTVIYALDNAVAFCRQSIEIWLDSEVVVGQLNGINCIRSDRVKPLFDEIKKLEHRFLSVKYFYHSRGSFWARAADKIANDEYSRIQKG